MHEAGRIVLGGGAAMVVGGLYYSNASPMGRIFAQQMRQRGRDMDAVEPRCVQKAMAGTGVACLGLSALFVYMAKDKTYTPHELLRFAARMTLLMGLIDAPHALFERLLCSECSEEVDSIEAHALGAGHVGAYIIWACGVCGFKGQELDVVGRHCLAKGHDPNAIIRDDHIKDLLRFIASLGSVRNEADSSVYIPPTKAARVVTPEPSPVKSYSPLPEDDESACDAGNRSEDERRSPSPGYQVALAPPESEDEGPQLQDEPMLSSSRYFDDSPDQEAELSVNEEDTKVPAVDNSVLDTSNVSSISNLMSLSTEERAFLDRVMAGAPKGRGRPKVRAADVPTRTPCSVCQMEVALPLVLENLMSLSTEERAFLDRVMAGAPKGRGRPKVRAADVPTRTPCSVCQMEVAIPLVLENLMSLSTEERAFLDRVMAGAPKGRGRPKVRAADVPTRTPCSVCQMEVALPLVLENLMSLSTEERAFLDRVMAGAPKGRGRPKVRAADVPTRTPCSVCQMEVALPLVLENLMSLSTEERAFLDRVMAGAPKGRGRPKVRAADVPTRTPCSVCQMEVALPLVLENLMSLSTEERAFLDRVMAGAPKGRGQPKVRAADVPTRTPCSVCQMEVALPLVLENLMSLSTEERAFLDRVMAGAPKGRGRPKVRAADVPTRTPCSVCQMEVALPLVLENLMSLSTKERAFLDRVMAGAPKGRGRPKVRAADVPTRTPCSVCQMEVALPLVLENLMSLSTEERAFLDRVMAGAPKGRGRPKVRAADVPTRTPCSVCQMEVALPLVLENLMSLSTEERAFLDRVMAGAPKGRGRPKVRAADVPTRTPCSVCQMEVALPLVLENLMSLSTEERAFLDRVMAGAPKGRGRPKVRAADVPTRTPCSVCQMEVALPLVLENLMSLSTEERAFLDRVMAGAPKGRGRPKVRAADVPTRTPCSVCQMEVALPLVLENLMSLSTEERAFLDRVMAGAPKGRGRPKVRAADVPTRTPCSVCQMEVALPLVLENLMSLSTEERAFLDRVMAGAPKGRGRPKVRAADVPTRTPCSVCQMEVYFRPIDSGPKYVAAAKLRTHVLSGHHEGFTKLFACPECPKRVNTRDSIVDHIRTQHPGRRELKGFVSQEDRDRIWAEVWRSFPAEMKRWLDATPAHRETKKRNFFATF